MPESASARPSPPVRLPAEWEPQSGVLLAWPPEASDWAPLLAAARRTFAAIGAAISRRTRLLLVCADDEAGARAALAAAGGDMARVTIVPAPLDDTWARDFGPITTVDAAGRRWLNDFRFNGWGDKFAAARDDRATTALVAAGALPGGTHRPHDLVLEGGSIESDGAGTILTTRRCLLAPTRNPQLDRGGVEAALGASLGAQRVLWLEHGELRGDDTDAHIDTLARLAPDDTIVYVACDDPADEHYEDLQAMAAELRALRTAAGRPYRLLPLPWPAAVEDPDDGHRLPATYANYLITNGAVLAPTYHQPEADAAALAVIADAHPGRAVVGLDCRTLIRQHGSLHCVTMQLPEGVLR